MEIWAFSSELLKQYAVHYRNGSVIPDNLIAKIHRAANFNEGFATTELLAAALSDLDIHSIKSADTIVVADFQHKALVEKRGLIPQIEPRYRYTYFNHIFNGGYSSGYYFYIWAEVLDKDAFEAFVESGDKFNTEIAARFREEILSKGGTRPGMDMYRSFRGADPDKEALLRARGFIEQEPVVEEQEEEIEVAPIDTRELARQRAERSRREREQEQE
jgi:peptidyl-dipeptidase Dcp